MIPIPKFILKNCLRPISISNLKQFHWLTHDDMEFELKLKGPFWVEISSNGITLAIAKHLIAIFPHWQVIMVNGSANVPEYFTQYVITSIPFGYTICFWAPYMQVN